MECIELRRQRDGGFLRRASSECIPRREWVRNATAAALSAISRLQSLDTEESIDETAEQLIVPAPLIAQLSDSEAHAIGLPPATDLILQLQSTGKLHDGSIQVEKRWLRRGGIDTYESDELQRRDFEARFLSKLPDIPLRHVQKSRRSTGDLHDRSVEARLRCGETALWDLGRGIEGVMTANHACTVNALRMPTGLAA